MGEKMGEKVVDKAVKNEENAAKGTTEKLVKEMSEKKKRLKNE